MKVCITAVGPDLDSKIDPRFGRCQYFLILDEDGELLKAIPNEGTQAMRGAGITAAQIVADQGVDVVITGNVGPRAYMVLEQSGIKIFPESPDTTVKEAFEKYIDCNKPAYIERKKMSHLEAIKQISKAGGLPFLAHPANIKNLEKFVARLKRSGLAGLEIYYAGYSSSTIARLLKLAKKYSLIASGGSDYHGLDNDIGANIGSVDIPHEAVEQFLSLAEHRRTVIS